MTALSRGLAHVAVGRFDCLCLEGELAHFSSVVARIVCNEHPTLALLATMQLRRDAVLTEDFA